LGIISRLNNHRGDFLVSYTRFVVYHPMKYIYSWSIPMSRKLKNLHAKSQISSFYSFRGLGVHTDGQTDRRTRSTQLVIPIKIIYYIYFISSKTLPSTWYILSDESYTRFVFFRLSPFTLRVTDMKISEKYII